MMSFAVLSTLLGFNTEDSAMQEITGRGENVGKSHVPSNVTILVILFFLLKFFATGLKLSAESFGLDNCLEVVLYNEGCGIT